MTENTLTGEIRPVDLKDYDGPLYVKNLTNNVISCDDGAPNKENYLRIGPQYSTENIQPLPPLVARSMGFQKLWRRGDVVVTTDPEMEEILRITDSKNITENAKREEELQTLVQKPAHSQDIFVGETQDVHGKGKSIHYGDTPPNGDYANWVGNETQGPDGTIIQYWTPVGITEKQKG